MAKQSGRDLRRVQALSAYEHAPHGDGGSHHLIDAREQPRFWRPTAGRAAPPPAAPAGPQQVVHGVDRPVRTSFKLGFGFAAGAWAFRVIVQLLVLGALLIVTLSLLARLF